MSPEELFSELSLWMVNLWLKSYNFCHYLIFILCILTCVDPDPYWEYGSGHESNTDPDPQNWLKGHKYIFFVCVLVLVTYRYLELDSWVNKMLMVNTIILIKILNFSQFHCKKISSCKISCIFRTYLFKLQAVLSKKRRK